MPTRNDLRNLKDLIKSFKEISREKSSKPKLRIINSTHIADESLTQSKENLKYTFENQHKFTRKEIMDSIQSSVSGFVRGICFFSDEDYLLIQELNQLIPTQFKDDKYKRTYGKTVAKQVSGILKMEKSERVLNILGSIGPPHLSEFFGVGKRFKKRFKTFLRHLEACETASFHTLNCLVFGLLKSDSELIESNISSVLNTIIRGIFLTCQSDASSLKLSHTRDLLKRISEEDRFHRSSDCENEIKLLTFYLVHDGKEKFIPLLKHCFKGRPVILSAIEATDKEYRESAA